MPIATATATATPTPTTHQSDSDSDIVRVSSTDSEFAKLKQQAAHTPATMTDVKPTLTDKDELQNRIDDTIRKVREKSDKLQAVAQPYALRTRDFAETRPVLFTFLVVFTALSAIPVFCFVAFLLSSIVLILGVAAIGICLSILCTILLATALLLPVLFFTFITSSFVLSFLLFLFLAHRLWLHLNIASRTESGETKADVEHIVVGVKNWAEETKGRVDLATLGITSKLRWADQGESGKWVVQVKEEAEK